MMEDAWAKSIDSLRKLDSDCTPFITDQHRRAIMLIHACIDLGLDHGSLIVAALHELGFKRRHVGIMLDTGTGPFPASHHWYKDRDGRYRSHPLK